MSVSDLTGYTWVATSDDPLNISTASYSMNFTSNNQNFTSLVLTRQTTILRYMSYDNLQVYESGIWTNEAYKTIEIIGGTDATNSTLIAWLEANGTLTAPAQPSASISIGTLSLAKAFLGTTELSAIWLGNVKLYEKGGSYDYNYSNGTLTINNAPYNYDNGVLTIE